MKIQMKHFISGCALFVTVLTACSDDDFEGKTSIKSGDAVQFAASSRTSTRTVYDDENIFQINWEEQDKIKIYSNKTYEGWLMQTIRLRLSKRKTPKNPLINFITKALLLHLGQAN